jgi:hypothetical protein
MLLQPFVFGVIFITFSSNLMLANQPSLISMYIAFTLLLLGGVLSISSLVELYKRIFIFCTGDNMAEKPKTVSLN